MQFKIKEGNKEVHCYNRVGVMQIIAGLVPEPYDVKKSCFAANYTWFYGEEGKNIHHPNFQWFLKEINKMYNTNIDAARSHKAGVGYIVRFEKPFKLKDIDLDALVLGEKKEAEKQVIIKDYKEEVKQEAKQEKETNEQQKMEENLQERIVESTEGEGQEDQPETETVSGSGTTEPDSQQRNVVSEQVSEQVSEEQPDFDSMIPPQWSKKKVSAEANKFGIELDSSKKMKEMVEEFKDKFESQS